MERGETHVDKNWMNLSWKVLVARGAMGILFGVVAIAAPVSTALAFALLWGIWALADGVGAIAQAFAPGGTPGARVLLVVMGAVALLAGVFAVTSPAVTAVTLTYVLGIWLVVRGVFELVAAIASTTAVPRALLVGGGLVDVLLGVLFVANPGRAAVGISVVLGLTAVVWGLVFVVVGLVVRSGASAEPSPA
jgi:uncharacterized membrane protein HdeD (DUF308 family)